MKYGQTKQNYSLKKDLTSGAMYPGVPAYPVAVCPSNIFSRARPKSAILI